MSCHNSGNSTLILNGSLKLMEILSPCVCRIISSDSAEVGIISLDPVYTHVCLLDAALLV